MSWSQPVFEQIAGLVSQQVGLTFPPNRRRDAESGIHRAMARHGFGAASQYLGLLKGSELPLDELIAELTIGETYFFREPGQFEVIRSQALPELQRIRPPDHVLQVWSAGCASGEEAYSLAMLLEEEWLSARARILGTDISQPALAKARAGLYGQWSLRGDGADWARRHLRQQGNRYQVKDALRRQVGFEALNLADDPAFAPRGRMRDMDLVLCRNVLIYFDAETIRRVSGRLLDSLAEGGWLFTAATDPALEEHAELERLVTPAGIAYRRRVRMSPPLVILPQERVPPAYALQEREGESQERLVIATRSPEAEAAAGEALLDRARAAWARGDYAGVAELTGGLEDSASSLLHIQALASFHGPAGALRAAREAVARHALSAELHFYLASLLQAERLDLQAAEAIRRVLYIDPTLAVAHFSLGTTLWRLGDLEGARRCYRNARDLCGLRPEDEPVPLIEGESAGRLAEGAAAYLALLESKKRGD